MQLTTVVLLGLVTAYLVVLYVRDRRHSLGLFSLPLWWRTRNDVCPDCMGGSDQRHGECAICGLLTCTRKAHIDPESLRRRMRYVCDKDWWAASGDDSDARKARRVKDWSEMTEPATSDLLTVELTEQYPGAVRSALRVFAESNEPFSRVSGIPANTLNDSIGALGLHDEIYAETRGTDTYLRRFAEADVG